MSGITRSFRNTHKGGKKASKRFKKIKRSNKSRRVQRQKKMKSPRKSRRSRRVYRQNRKKLSRKARRSSRSGRSGRSRSTRRKRQNLKGGSGAASDWMSSYSNSETVSCPEGKIEVPWLDQAGITTPKDGINPQGIQDSLTTTFRQANENRSMDGNVGK